MNNTASVIKNDKDKTDKKILREAINVGIEKDKTAALFAINAIIEKWKSREIDYTTAYSEMYSAIQRFDKIIANRYDDVTGSQYLSVVAQLFAIGHINESHLNGLSEDVLNRILLFKQLRDEQ